MRTSVRPNVPVSGCEAVRSTGLVGHVPARPKRRNEPMHRVGEMADPRYDGGATAQGGVPGDRARDRLQVSRQATAAKASRIAGSSPAPVPNDLNEGFEKGGFDSVVMPLAPDNTKPLTGENAARQFCKHGKRQWWHTLPFNGWVYKQPPCCQTSGITAGLSLRGDNHDRAKRAKRANRARLEAIVGPSHCFAQGCQVSRV